MGKQHIIELNGKRYDAVTGKMIAPSPIVPPQTKTPDAKPAGVDGFAKMPKPAGNPVPTNKAEKSKTLMRKTVSKPAPPPAPKPHSRIQERGSAVSGHKQLHAGAVPRSALIQRFNDMLPAPNKQVQAADKPQPAARLHAVATATTVANGAIASSLASASSHAQPKTVRTKLHAKVAKRLKISSRILSAGSLALAGLLIGGFFMYQNIPNLTMRLASARAGVHGTLPGYQPAGFSLRGGISYKPGQITVGYKANSDDRNFTITQTPSSWNSETLAQNYAALKEGSTYQTIPTKGKTVYIYNGSNATWVDGGIWYRVEGNSELNSDQLLNLANSM